MYFYEFAIFVIKSLYYIIIYQIKFFSLSIRLEPFSFFKIWKYSDLTNCSSISESSLRLIIFVLLTLINSSTCLGLYLSKTIIEEHHNGILLAYNTQNGVCFKIELEGIPA